jgi:hypothetical protein
MATVMATVMVTDTAAMVIMVTAITNI